MWGLWRERDAGSRQELPIFPVMEITDRVQPKPGIARPKKERERREGGMGGRKKGRNEKAQMFEAKVKIAACPV